MNRDTNITFYKEDEVIKMNAISDDNRDTYFVKNPDGSFSISSNTIELLENVPGERVFMSTDPDYESMSREDLIIRLRIIEHESIAKDYVSNLIDKKDIVIQQCSWLAKQIECKGWNPLSNLSANLRSLADDIDKYVNFELNFEKNITGRF